MSWYERREQLRSSWLLPIGLAIALGGIYLAELQLAGSYRYGAAYLYITSLPSDYDLIVGIFAPFLHSNHDHFSWNLGFFLILSWIVLTVTDPQEYVIVVAVAAWITASVVPWLAAGGVGFGISGANAALAGWAAILRGRSMQATSDDVDSLVSGRYALAVLLFTVPTTLAIYNIGQGFGLVAVGDGVSVVGHFLGGFIGLTYGSVTAIQSRV